MSLLPNFSEKYSHPSLAISEDGISVMGIKGRSMGYKTALAISKQEYFEEVYFEAQIESGDGFVRIGFGTKECELRGPLGIDRFGYSYGSKNGYGFHKSTRIRFGERFKKNDVVSAYLYKEKNNTSIQFFINGVQAEKYFWNIHAGEYWPAVSIYGKCRIKCTFGPYFIYKKKILGNISECKDIKQ